MAGASLPWTLPDRFGYVLDRVGTAVRRRFAIDVRALAAFRIALGSLLLVDLLLRSRTLVAFYTDAGVLPGAALVSDYGDPFTLHALSGEAWAQALLFLLAGGFAVALLVGYRTRLATLGSWLLLVSLHVRNPMVLNGGDVLLRMLVFWGLFLPLGERWSLDARRVDRSRTTVATVGTVAVLSQVVVLYVANAGFKLEGDRWLAGEAISYAFSLDQFTILLGNFLAEQHLLLSAFTYSWLALLVASPLLVLLTGRARAVLASLFVGMHLGMLVTMRLGLFPLIVVAGLLLFYPSFVWDAVASRATRLGLPDAIRRSGRRLPAVRPGRRSDGLGLVSDVAGPSILGRFSRARTVCSTALPAVFLVLVLLSNAASAGLAEVEEPAETVLDLTETDQSWRLFAPDPKGTDGWFVVPGTLADGSRVDVFHGGPVDWDRPPTLESAYPTARWRKYLSNVWAAGNTNHRSYFANYLCGAWNRTHATGVTNLTVYVMAQPSQPFADEEPIERRELEEYDCSGDLRQ